MNLPLPGGVVTFLMTDIEGSPRLWEEHRDAMAAALETHDRILQRAIAEHDGAIVKTTGDGMITAFERTEAAVRCAIDAQRLLLAKPWPDAIRLAVSGAGPML